MRRPASPLESPLTVQRFARHSTGAGARTRSRGRPRRPRHRRRPRRAPLSRSRRSNRPGCRLGAAMTRHRQRWLSRRSSTVGQAYNRPQIMTIDEQLAYLTKGCVDVVRAARAAREARTVREDRPAARREGRLRSHRAGSAPGPHGAHPQDEALPGSRAHGRLRRRRLHGADRRSDRPIEDAAAADDSRRSRATPRPTRRRSSSCSIRQKTVASSTASG